MSIPLSDEEAVRPPVRPLPVLLGGLLFMVLMLLLPASWLLGVVPLKLEQVGKLLYLACAVVGPASLVARGDTSDRPTATLIAAGLVFLAIVVMGMAGQYALGELTDDFASRSIVNRVESPSGRLLLVHENIDEGALGGSSVLYVRSRIVPTVVRWEQRMLVEGYPERLGWDGDRNVLVNGMRRRVFAPIVWLGW